MGETVWERLEGMVLFDAVCHQGRLCGFKKLVPSRSPGLAGPSCQLQTPFHLYFLHLFLLSSDIFSNYIFLCLFVCLFSKSFSSNTQNLGFQIQVFQSHFFSLVFRTTFFLVFYLIFSHNIYWSYSSPSHTTSYSHSLSETKGRKMKNKQNLVRHKYQNKNITKSPTK